MVRYLHLKTRYASTMAARTLLIGLLHRRWHTQIPLLLPSHIPKSTCPWTVPVLPNHLYPPTILTYADPPTILTYAAVLRTPSLHRKRPPTPRCKRLQFHQLICCGREKRILPSPQRTQRLRRGSWQWQSLAHRLDLLLPLPTSTPTTTSIIPDNFDPIACWLPTLCSVTSSPSSDTHPNHAIYYPHPDDDCQYPGIPW